MILALSLTACGEDTSKTVATVGSTKVSRATLDHWMEVTLGIDYHTAVGSRAPDGLLTDPPNHARCVRSVETIVPRTAGRPELTAEQMGVKCRRLYAAIKEQALNFLLSSLQIRAEASELGVRTPSESDITGGVQAYADHDFGSVAGFRSVIAQQRRSLADVRFLVETNLLQAKLTAHLEAHAKRLGDDGRATIYKLILEAAAKQRTKTSCSPGYRATECKQYGSEDEAQLAPNLVLEHFQKGIG